MVPRAGLTMYGGSPGRGFPLTFCPEIPPTWLRGGSHSRFYAEQSYETIQDVEYLSGTPGPGISTFGVYCLLNSEKSTLAIAPRLILGGYRGVKVGASSDSKVERRGGYRGTWLIRKSAPLGPYTRTMSTALWWP